VNLFGEPLGPLKLLPGDIWKVDPTILEDNTGEHAEWRRAVILYLPKDLTGRLTVITRTSDVNRRPGIFSPEDKSIDLSKPGVWGYMRTSPAALWTPDTAKYCGTCPAGEFDAVLELFG
jgi:hypothetical protein